MGPTGEIGKHRPRALYMYAQRGPISYNRRQSRARLLVKLLTGQ